MIPRLVARMLDGRVPEDDVAVVLAELGPVPAQLEVEVPARPEHLAPLRRRLRAWLHAHAVPDDRIEQTLVAASEALTNAVEHGGATGARRVQLAAEIDRRQERLVLRVADDGGWRPQRSQPERGRGLLLMRGLMDDVLIDAGPGGTVATLVAGLGAPRRNPEGHMV